MNKETYVTPNAPMPGNVIEFNPDICIGCNMCVDACRTDVLVKNTEKGQPPIAVYIDECWNCGCCILACKKQGAIIFRHPLNQSLLVSWKRKETGEIFRLGMKNPPPAYTKPPCE